MSAVLTPLIRSLALMMLIKNLGRHSSAPYPTLEGPSTPGAGHHRPASAASRSPTPLETVGSPSTGVTRKGPAPESEPWKKRMGSEDDDGGKESADGFEAAGRATRKDMKCVGDGCEW
jgi:hypothetical protein